MEDTDDDDEYDGYVGFLENPRETDRMLPRLRVRGDDRRTSISTMREYRKKLLWLNAYTERSISAASVHALIDEIHEDISILEDFRDVAHFCPRYVRAAACMRMHLAMDLGDARWDVFTPKLSRKK